MEGDGFSDPRHRAARRPRGGARGRGRGRGQQHRRGSQKRSTSNIRPQPAPNLGSNEYRFRPSEEDDEENAYEAGVDFQEASSQSMYDSTLNTDLQRDVNLSNELSADFSKLESVLASVPLWVRLGEYTKFALGIPEEDKIENYLDPLPFEDSTSGELTTSKNEPSEEFLTDLAGLSLEDDNLTVGEGQSISEVKNSNEIQTEKDRQDTISASRNENLQEALPSQPEEPDDFDKWLDEI